MAPKNSKQIKTDYKQAKSLIEKDSNKLIHIHSPFGTGKSVLAQNLNFNSQGVSKDSVIIYDRFLSTADEIDAAFISKNSNDIDNTLKKIHQLRGRKNLLSTLFQTLVTLSTIFAPIAASVIQNIWTQLIPVYLLLLLMPLIFNILCISQELNNREKRVLIFENIDRCQWDIILDLFNQSYMHKRSSYIHKIIFTYDMNNLLERYEEKYFRKTNLYSFLDKFVELEIDLGKYSESVKRVIVAKMVKSYCDKLRLEIDHNLVQNYRILERALKFINKNSKPIKELMIDPSIAFWTYYISISDKPAYEYLINSQLYINEETGYRVKKWYERSNIDLFKAAGNKEVEFDECPDLGNSSIKIIENIMLKLDTPEIKGKSITIDDYVFDDNFDLIYSTFKNVSKSNEIKDISTAKIPRYLIRKLLNDIDKFSAADMISNFGVLSDYLGYDKTFEVFIKTSTSYDEIDIFTLLSYFQKIMNNFSQELPISYLGDIKPHDYQYYIYFLEFLFSDNIDMFFKHKFSNSNNIDVIFNDRHKTFIGAVFSLMIAIKNKIENLKIKDLKIPKDYRNWHLYEIVTLHKYISNETLELNILKKYINHQDSLSQFYPSYYWDKKRMFSKKVLSDNNLSIRKHLYSKEALLSWGDKHKVRTKVFKQLSKRSCNKLITKLSKLSKEMKNNR